MTVGIFSAKQIQDTLEEMGVSHLIWIPDSTFGSWEEALEQSSKLQLLRVCREGEAWPLAAGLHIAGASPVVVMQSTGLFESGDALRNVLFDLQLPLFAIIGARNWLIPDSPDSARRFTFPIVEAWGLKHVFIESEEQTSQLADHYAACQAARVPGAVVIAEGKG